jgi:hypothetical protein
MAATNKKTNPLLPMSAGCIAGGIEACAVWPMEFIKVSFSSHFRRAAERFSVLGFGVFYYALESRFVRIELSHDMRMLS